MRLIDANELIEHMYLGTEYDKTVDDNMEKTEAINKAFKCGWNDALASVMDYAPTVDAVPVVRCKDCKWYERKYSWNNHVYECSYLEAPMDDNDYCSLGERKEDEDT